MALQINADRSQRALVHGAQLPWVGSPESGVDRRMLEREGDEVAMASSIVRYGPGRSFPTHTHGLGEEFVVLEGVFSDGEGDYQAGTYVRNPPGSKHAPFSRDGCVIFVKLRQMRVGDTALIRAYPADRRWVPGDSAGHERALLHVDGDVSVHLERAAPGTRVPALSRRGGQEIFVLSGALQMSEVDGAVLEAWSWLRDPGERQSGFVSERGALWWVKRGHLP